MKAYILRRMLWVPVVLLVVSFVTFALGNYGPGDPFPFSPVSTGTPMSSPASRNSAASTTPSSSNMAATYGTPYRETSVRASHSAANASPA